MIKDMDLVSTHGLKAASKCIKETGISIRKMDMEFYSLEMATHIKDNSTTGCVTGKAKCISMTKTPIILMDNTLKE